MAGQMTPMLRQYNEIKARFPDAILFFRLGDFYEMFGDDAIKASRILEITLTSREVGKGERIPMCGVPYHAVDSYVATLVSKGFKVAICDQLEDPAKAKGVVHRDVTRIVTPGTVTLEQALEAKNQRLLAALCRHQRSWGLACLDASTGGFWATEIGEPDAVVKVAEELARLRPAELLLGPGVAERLTVREVPSQEYDPRAFALETAYRLLTRHFQTHSLHSFGVEDKPAAIRAAGAALAYLAETQRTSLAHVTHLVSYQLDDHMRLDEATRRNLELTARLRDGRVEGTLLSVLDQTITAMGGRLLRRWVEQPLRRKADIEARLDVVNVLVDHPSLRHRLAQGLQQVADMERLLGRVASQTANGRDLLALARSLAAVPGLRRALEEILEESGYVSTEGNTSVQRAQDDPRSPAIPPSLEGIRQLASRLDPVEGLAQKITATLVDEPPISVREGGLIRDGCDAEVDRLRRLARDGQGWIAAFEERERERTGIRSLKVGYNKVFGYYIEVTRPNLDRVPPDYQRRQTLSNAERFITPDLKEQESQILGASERLVEREYELFVNLREEVTAHIPRIQATAAALAELDVYRSLAETAVSRGYVRPIIHDGRSLRIREGRHPVVECLQTETGFVANDVELDPQSTRLIILTGPNMAGKSTFLRQVALIVLMAQMGSFVPASEAHIGVVDRIFTRIGASDDLASGQSTFMVEMNEAAHILLHATDASLVLLDELGRGTSTYDGMALAQAIAEYLHDTVGAKTIMSTHYHELTQLEQHLPFARNFHAAVREEKGRVAFLYRILPGAADRSYGVNVARMAGLPDRVLRRAQQVLNHLEAQALQWVRQQVPGQLALPGFTVAVEASEQEVAAAASAPPSPLPVPLAEVEALLKEIESVDITTTTPLQALMLVESWQRRLAACANRNGWPEVSAEGGR